MLHLCRTSVALATTFLASQLPLAAAASDVELEERSRSPRGSDRSFLSAYSPPPRLGGGHQSAEPEAQDLVQPPVCPNCKAPMPVVSAAEQKHLKMCDHTPMGWDVVSRALAALAQDPAHAEKLGTLLADIKQRSEECDAPSDEELEELSRPPEMEWVPVPGEPGSFNLCAKAPSTPPKEYCPLFPTASVRDEIANIEDGPALVRFLGQEKCARMVNQVSYEFQTKLCGAMSRGARPRSTIMSADSNVQQDIPFMPQDILFLIHDLTTRHVDEAVPHKCGIPL